MAWVLSDEEETVLVLEGFVDLDDLWVVEGGEDAVLVDDVVGRFHKFLLDALDCAREVGVVSHLRAVDSGKGTATHNLN